MGAVLSLDDEGEIHRCTAEDGLTASLTLENGVTVALDSTFAATTAIPPRVLVTGSAGSVEVVADRRITIRRPGTEPEEIDVSVNGAFAPETGP